MLRKIGFLLLSFLLFSISLLPLSKTSPCASAQVISAECVMEIESGRILYQQHGDVRLPMASTTKILTAISVMESGYNLETPVNVPDCAIGVEGSSAYLKSGEAYSGLDLLYGLMLRSGNDCAVALAELVDGGIENFATRMNKTAQRAGAVNSRFVNPHGLPAQNHYTTAVDLTLITAYAMKNPLFEKIVSTKYYTERAWKNKNKMLSSYDGAIGVKTGYTKEAGRCLVTAAEKDGMRVAVTVLNCPTMYERTKVLLDDAFNGYKNRLLLGADKEIVFEGGKGVAGTDFYYPLMDDEIQHVEIVAHAYKSKENKKIVGQFEIYLLKRLLFSGNLYKL